MQRSPCRLAGWLILLSVVCSAVSIAQTPTASASAPPGGNPLPLPSTLPLAEFEQRLFAFLQERQYKTLGWKRDKGIRDTGPFVNGQYYGNHTAVTIYYSPELIAWLERNRQGPVPQNAMIIKEMYDPPAARYYRNQRVTFRTADLLPDAEQQKGLQAWTIMIKDATVAKDGWFWGSVPVGKQAQEEAIRFDQDPFTTGPWTGFAQYCFRCHASAEREMTFSDLSNIEGYPGDPLTFLNDGSSWQQAPPPQSPPLPPPQRRQF